MAQAAPAPAAQEEAIVEEVVVTGSRIRRDPTNSPTPLIQVGREELLESGQTNVIDFLADIPALSFSITPEDTTGSNLNDGGLSLLNLRGLGSVRTLTLVDGRRHVGSSPGTLSVDVDSIPRLLIKDIEVITGGASAVYGADAVSGAVNFILRKDFQGLEVDGSVAQINQDGQLSKRLSGLIGHNFLDGRLNVYASAEYDTSAEVLDADVDWRRQSWGLLTLDVDPSSAADLAAGRCKGAIEPAACVSTHKPPGILAMKQNWARLRIRTFRSSRARRRASRRTASRSLRPTPPTTPSSMMRLATPAPRPSAPSVASASPRPSATAVRARSRTPNKVRPAVRRSHRRGAIRPASTWKSTTSSRPSVNTSSSRNAPTTLVSACSTTSTSVRSRRGPSAPSPAPARLKSAWTTPTCRPASAPPSRPTSAKSTTRRVFRPVRSPTRALNTSCTAPPAASSITAS
ncbi:MAG: hypothetical protein B7Z12_13910 [Caulobacter vibrioides]|uniref:TonB-dependent receptor plug domain-containing protein n=1 Tax=Caulobacter vibrioides TaxID=155892 RepID=A0A258D2N4_CAUVI|nr:MAG: hypothetical protein B7Z12_13910 [Caulobacter vibrioides]